MALCCWLTYVRSAYFTSNEQVKAKGPSMYAVHIFSFQHTIVVCSTNFEVNDDGYIQGNSLRRGCGTIEIRSPDNVRLVPHCFCFCFVFVLFFAGVL